MKKVLVVEDNLDNFRLISYALRRHGYEILHAQSGEEGIEIARREKPFFILMDVNLPGLDGLETTKKLRELEEIKDTPIIAITSFAMAGDRERILSSGCNGYFEKPIDPLTIIESIHKIIGIE